MFQKDNFVFLNTSNFERELDILIFQKQISLFVSNFCNHTITTFFMNLGTLDVNNNKMYVFFPFSNMFQGFTFVNKNIVKKNVF